MRELEISIALSWHKWRKTDRIEGEEPWLWQSVIHFSPLSPISLFNWFVIFYILGGCGGGIFSCWHVMRQSTLSPHPPPLLFNFERQDSRQYTKWHKCSFICYFVLISVVSFFLNFFFLVLVIWFRNGIEKWRTLILPVFLGGGGWGGVGGGEGVLPVAHSHIDIALPPPPQLVLWMHHDRKKMEKWPESVSTMHTQCIVLISNIIN